MFKIRKEQMGQIRKAYNEQLRQAQLRAFREQGISTEDDPSTRTSILTDKAGGTAKIMETPTGVSVTSGEGRTYQFEHDSQGHLTAVTDPAGLRVEYERDADYRLVAIHRGSDNSLHFKYDAQSFLSAITFPDNSIYEYNHNDKGQVTAAIDRNGDQTNYEYLRTGELLSQVDKNGNKTWFEYAGFDAPSAIVFPNGEDHEFEYNEGGHLSQMRVNGREHATFKIDTFADTYDITYADGTHAHFPSNDKKIVEASNETCTVKLKYDDKGRIISEDTDGQIVNYLYNQVGALIAIITPDGEKLQFERDKEHRVSRITDWAGNQYEIEYDLSGALGAIKYPNGTTLSQQVTPMGLPESLRVISPKSPKPIIACDYSYDKCDRLVEATENDVTKNYSYDDEGRLLGIQASHFLASEQFKPDYQGNNTQKASHYYNELDQLEQQGGQSFSYDPLGNMTTGACPNEREAQYDYNGRNQLVSVITPAGETRYAYDAFGRRIRKESNGKITRYVWAGQQLLSEVTETHGQAVAGRDFVVFPECPYPLAMRVDGKVCCVHPVRRAEVLCVTDQGGKVVWQAEYSAFGVARVVVQGVFQPWRLAGQYCDEETGLYYVLARYFNPQLGRYLSKDPLFVAGGSTNFYIYCDGDPINRYDPNGELVLRGVPVGDAIGAAVGGRFERYCRKKAFQRDEPKDYNDWNVAQKGVVGGAGGMVRVGAAVEGAFVAVVNAMLEGKR